MINQNVFVLKISSTCFSCLLQTREGVDLLLVSNVCSWTYLKGSSVEKGFEFIFRKKKINDLINVRAFVEEEKEKNM